MKTAKEINCRIKSIEKEIVEHYLYQDDQRQRVAGDRRKVWRSRVDELKWVLGEDISKKKGWFPKDMRK